MRVGPFLGALLLTITGSRLKAQDPLSRQDSLAVRATARHLLARLATQRGLPAPRLACVGLAAATDSATLRVRDASISFLRHLGAMGIPVAPLSRCRQDPRPPMTIRDGAQGAPALSITLGPVRWDGDTVAVVPASYVRAGLWGATYICRVERTRRRGDGTVRGCRIDSIAQATLGSAWPT